MITAISSVNANSSKQLSQVAFQGNSARLIEAELGSKASKLGEKATDFFSKLAKEEKLPFTKKPLIAADLNTGPPVIDVTGQAISDPAMPGTVIHELASGDPGFAEAVAEHSGGILEHIGDAFHAILEAIF